MAELTTAVQHNLPVKIVILKNNSLAEVAFEQQEIGNPVYGCDLSPIDFVAFARACGADGFRCERPEEVRPALQAAFASSRAAVVEAIVDANEKPRKSRRTQGLGGPCGNCGGPPRQNPVPPAKMAGHRRDYATRKG